MVAQRKAAKGKPASRKKTTARTRTTPKRAARTTAKKPAARRPTEPRRIPIIDDPQPRRSRIPFEDEAPPRAEQDAPTHSPFQPGFSPECMACPICMLFYVVKNTKPEAMEHLMKAAFELMQAGKAVFEQYTERFEQAEKLQRINIS